MDSDSTRQIWETALGELQIQVSKHNYQTWLKNTVGLSYQDNQFTIGVPNSFIAEYLDKNQRSLIEKTLMRLTHRHAHVQFEVDSSEYHPPGSDCSAYEPSPPKPTGAPAFNPKYTFDSFVVGTGNRMAYAAALGAADSPGETYNPLFIYGGVGLGKTHLLHAIGHKAMSNRLEVRYVSCEKFTNEFIQSIQEKQTETFRQRYRSVDMLMIDDVQFISGKEQTEECLFHTFNELHNKNRQIVITSDRPPKSIPRVAERLRSRFEWGLAIDIQPPDHDTRLSILQSKAQQRGADIPLDALEIIARQLQQNIRELEGNLNRVIAYAKLLQAKATPDLVLKALENLASKTESNEASAPSVLIEAVARSFQLNPDDLKSQKRDKEIVLARQIAMFLIREQTGCPLVQIGRAFGNRNPSTVRHACEKIDSEVNVNPYLKRTISDIRQQTGSQ